MSELKTKKNSANVSEFISSVEDKTRREDSYRILGIMKKVTRREPEMWGATMVGFGSYYYKYASGRDGNWFVTGFSPRKQNLTVYIMPGFASLADLLGKLGKHKLGKSCLYINSLADVDIRVLEQIIRKSVAQMRKSYKCT